MEIAHSTIFWPWWIRLASRSSRPRLVFATPFSGWKNRVLQSLSLSADISLRTSRWIACLESVFLQPADLHPIRSFSASARSFTIDSSCSGSLRQLEQAFHRSGWSASSYQKRGKVCTGFSCWALALRSKYFSNSTTAMAISVSLSCPAHSARNCSYASW